MKNAFKKLFKKKEKPVQKEPAKLDVELKRWKTIPLKQIYKDSCIATGLEYIIRYNDLDSSISGISDFQKYFNFGNDNSFGHIEIEIKKHLYYKDIDLRRIYFDLKVKNFKTDKEGFLERMSLMAELISQDIPVLLPVFQEDLGWHIMPVIRMEEDCIWLLRRNYGGYRQIDIVKNIFLRRYFLNEEGGEDLAWIDKPEKPKENTEVTDGKVGKSEDSKSDGEKIRPVGKNKANTNDQPKKDSPIFKGN